MAAYSPPDWGVDGANAFGIYVEVIKSGVVVESTPLPVDACKSCVVFGRMEPLCDVVLAHPSISRVHAALQFDAQGALFLRDLESTHGTFINKKRVQAGEFVRLHIGDVLVFGESTRLYAVCGPPELLPQEYDSLNLQAFREKSEKRQEKKAVQRKSSSSRRSGAADDRDSGASWGFGEDAVEEDDEDEDGDDGSSGKEGGDKEKLPDYLRNLKEDETPYKSSLKQTEVNEKDQKLFQQLQTRIKKMENLKLEKSRIQAKQNQLTGLTEGQEKTLERNEQRIEALKKEIEGIEERIHAKNAQREKTKSAAGSSSAAAGGASSGNGRKKQSVNEKLYGYESDEDDFYDRTTSNQRKHLERKQQLGVVAGDAASTAPVAPGPAKSSAKSQGAVITAESIQVRIRTLEYELSEVVRELEQAQSAASRDMGQEHKQEEEEEVDSLDSFMASTTHELHSTQLSSIESRKRDLEAELRRQRQLLVVATPALAAVLTPALRAGPKPDTEPARQPPVAAPESPAKSLAAQDSGDAPEETSQPDASSDIAPAAVSTTRRAEPREEEAPTEKEPSIKEKESTGVKSHRSSSSSATGVKAHTPVVESSVPAKKRRVAGPARPPPTSSKSSESAGFGSEASTLEGGDSVWVPPSNQTGDGRTKLNDKYGY